MPNMVEAIEANVTFDLADYPVVIWVEGVYHYRPDAWPSEHGPAPSLETVEGWMNA
jgi:hypothetical protein